MGKLQGKSAGLTQALFTLTNSNNDSIRFIAFSLPGPFAPSSESANRTLANSLSGQFTPWPFRSWPFCSLANSLPGPFAPWPYHSVELSFPGEKWPALFSRERKFLRTFAFCNYGYKNFSSNNPGHCYAIRDIRFDCTQCCAYIRMLLLMRNCAIKRYRVFYKCCSNKR